MSKKFKSNKEFNSNKKFKLSKKFNPTNKFNPTKKFNPIHELIYSKSPLFLQKLFLGEERAQAEAVFRLMIDSVIGLAILLIILSALNYFNSQNVEQSKKDFFTLVKNSVNTPNGVVLKSKELFFKKGFTVEDGDLEFNTNLPRHCFSFQDNFSNTVSVTEEGKKVVVNQDIKLFVYVRCDPVIGCDPYSASDCCAKCLVSFAHPIT